MVYVAEEFGGGKRFEFLTKRGSQGGSASSKLYFIGVEIEKEYDECTTFRADRVARVSDEFFMNSGDGSLDNGVEFQSMPATFGYHRELFHNGYYERFFNVLERNGLMSESSAGSHIHVSRNAITHATFTKMCKMMYEVFTPTFMRRIARRQDNCSWARRSNIDYTAVATGRNSDKYNAMNNQRGASTYEFRIWASPTNAEELMAQIEFVVALKEYCRPRHIDRLTQRGFRRYVLNHEGRYPNLQNVIRDCVPVLESPKVSS